MSFRLRQAPIPTKPRSRNIQEEVEKVVHADGKYVMPGFIDLHVHLREPGFEYKETIQTGALAAARGGFTTICPTELSR